MPYSNRCSLYSEIEKARGSQVIAYVTGDRGGLETQIAGDAYSRIADHLDLIGVTEKISLFLYTRGGDTMTAWSLINLIKQFCDEYEVIVPMMARSAGTLLALGASKIVMTKQATLGPIDPSVNTPLNPPVPNTKGALAPVSVEAIQGYFALAAEELHINDQEQKARVFLKLAEVVHPLVLGQAYRSRSQIQMLARKLMEGKRDPVAIDRIVGFLCSESGSHDYPIHRREATSQLQLPIEKPSEELYRVI